MHSLPSSTSHSPKYTCRYIYNVKVTPIPLRPTKKGGKKLTGNVLFHFENCLHTTTKESAPRLLVQLVSQQTVENLWVIGRKPCNKESDVHSQQCFTQHHVKLGCILILLPHEQHMQRGDTYKISQNHITSKVEQWYGNKSVYYA